MMEINEILAHVDHTLLSQTATWDEIRQICDDGMKYHTASVCIPASYVKQAAEYVKYSRLKILMCNHYSIFNLLVQFFLYNINAS